MNSVTDAVLAVTAIANAREVLGTIVKVDTQGFISILSKADKPLVVQTKGGFFSKNHKYLTAYKGFIFLTKSSTPLNLPSDAELVFAKYFWLPTY